MKIKHTLYDTHRLAKKTNVSRLTLSVLRCVHAAKKHCHARHACHVHVVPVVVGLRGKKRRRHGNSFMLGQHQNAFFHLTATQTHARCPAIAILLIFPFMIHKSVSLLVAFSCQQWLININTRLYSTDEPQDEGKSNIET